MPLCDIYHACMMSLRGLRGGPFECDFHKSATSIRSSTCKRTLNLGFDAAALQKKIIKSIDVTHALRAHTPNR